MDNFRRFEEGKEIELKQHVVALDGARPLCIFLDKETAADMKQWLVERNRVANASLQTLFLTCKGEPLSASAVDIVLRRIGIACGIVVCARVLRNSYLERQQKVVEYSTGVQQSTELVGQPVAVLRLMSIQNCRFD